MNKYKYKVKVLDKIVNKDKEFIIEAETNLDARKEAVDLFTMREFSPAQRLATYKQKSIPMLTNYLKCLGLKIERCKKV
jgi:hypothetical protein